METEYPAIEKALADAKSGWPLLKQYCHTCKGTISKEERCSRAKEWGWCGDWQKRGG